MTDGYVLDSFVIDLFAAEHEAAQRVLSGAPVVVLPLGEFHRYGTAREVTPEVAAEFVAHYAQRQQAGIRRARVAVDVDHAGGAVGWYKDVAQSTAGVTATFSWNQRGRALLEEGAYAYFSPTVAWEMEDRVTGEVTRNHLVGGALTNYPFFGEATALYSLRAGAAWYAVTKREGDQELPARAFLVVEDPEKVTTWHLPVMTWQGGELKPDRQLLGAAHAALVSPGGFRGKRYQGPQKAAALEKLRAMYEREGMKFNAGGDIMPDGENSTLNVEQAAERGVKQFFASLVGRGVPEPPPAAGVTVEQFAALQAQVAEVGSKLQAVTAERDTYAQRVEQLGGQLSGVQEAREVERFSRLAAGLAHLPSQTGSLAQELRWLYSADTTEGQGHAEFFAGLLRAADQEFAQAFAAVGGRGLPVPGTARGEVEVLVKQYQANNAAASYEQAVSAVFANNAGLYERYRAEVG